MSLALPPPIKAKQPPRNEVVAIFYIAILQRSQRGEQHIQLLHQRLHVEAITQDQEDGVVASDSAQDLVDALIVDRHRDSARIARLGADDTHIA